MEEEDARVDAKSRPMRNLVALTPKRSSQLSISSSTLQSLRNTGASCSSLDPRSTGRPSAKDLSASNAPTSQVWPEDPDTDTGTGRPVATPNERPTDKGLACHTLSVTSGNWTFVDRVLKNVRRNFGLPAQDTGPDLHQRSNVENVYEFLYVGLCASQQGSGSEPACSSKHGCLRDPTHVLYCAKRDPQS